MLRRVSSSPFSSASRTALALTGTPAQAVASGSLLETLHDRSSKRVIATYAAALSDAAAVMGTAMFGSPDPKRDMDAIHAM